MLVGEVVDIIAVGPTAESALWRRATRDLERAISLVDWPQGAGSFSLNPTPRNVGGKLDRHPNGVVPIKRPILAHLAQRGWACESLPPLAPGQLLRTGDMDALLTKKDDRIAFEWETGNVSSSHRAISKLLDALFRQTITGAVLALPMRATQRYLTDRVGNYEELEPYFDLWGKYPVPNGVLRIYGVLHDALDPSAPYIPKGVSGRARR